MDGAASDVEATKLFKTFHLKKNFLTEWPVRLNGPLGSSSQYSKNKTTEAKTVQGTS